ncbi:MAG: acetolactate synthase [Planctomycetota bacterium]|nr:MAG: acetolactate synthase [Planctomycetota bacterium]
METTKQISVRLVNKPGRLAAMLNTLHKEKVSFRALVVMDSDDRGTVRFVPDDLDKACEVLDQQNVRYDVTDVLMVDLPKQGGGFRNICERLAEEHLNIDYAYCAFGGSAKNGVAVIKVNNIAKAQKVLGDKSTAGKMRGSVRRPMYAR